MAYGDFKEVQEVASGDEGGSNKNKKPIDINSKDFTQEIAQKWIDNHNTPNNNITLNRIELKKAKEVAKYGS